ncbi:MAG: hypothetical protein IH984_11930 [Planctomycetes bacterium]|nr:hypothetical protein [Planctomycetota bacterium]
MKRKRRHLKWVGAAACALLLCAWIGTFWSAFGYQTRTVVVVLSVGCFEVSVYPKGMPTQAPGWFAAWQPYEVYWLPRLIHGTFITSRTTHVFVPLWIPLVLVGVATILAFRHDWRFAPGHCQMCDYDLRGDFSTGCPECGWEREDVS